MIVTTYDFTLNETRPTVSLIVPMYDDGKHIAQCFDALVEQDYPADSLEIFIVDGMSADNSAVVGRRI